VSYRALSTRLPVYQSARVLKSQPRQTMSFLPRALIGSEPSQTFNSLFRFLDDFDAYTSNHRSHFNNFSPRFDVKELPESYELHGELPGVEQKDVDIEFTDTQTLTIRGRTESSVTSGTPPATSAIEDTTQVAAISEDTQTDANEKKGHQATVENENAPIVEVAEGQVTSAAAPSSEAVETAKPEGKFWISERSVGEFARSFSFPARVDQDAVKASMKNGILSIVIPKLKAESRKVTID